MKRYLPAFILFVCIQNNLAAQAIKDTICILQLNDVYEIAPLNQGKVGGMARVATIVKQYDARYKTYVVLAGDFVSPSVIGTTKIDGQRVNGRHMVDMMNKAGVDIVTFGNHEFDIPEKDLQQRINESQFAWVSSDVLHKNADSSVGPFYKTTPDSVPVAKYLLLPSAHKQFTIGLVTATIASNKQPWVQYATDLQPVTNAYNEVRKQADAVIALTHLALAEDEQLLRKLKKVLLVTGGHEHQHNYVTINKRSIAKADANAKTMYRHLVYKDGKSGAIKITSTLLQVDTTVIPDAAIAADVKLWEDKAYAAFKAIGLQPDSVVYHTSQPLDGTEAHLRYGQTNLGNIIATAMLQASPAADAAVFNSGSIRIDDMIEGTITQLDIIRTLPFGGKLCEVTLTGNLLNQLLSVGNSLKGLGGFLQLSTNLSFNGTSWLLNGTPIDGTKTYKIVSPEYLFSGNEKGLEFLKESNYGIVSIKRFDDATDVHTDLRLAVVKYLSTL